MMAALHRPRPTRRSRVAAWTAPALAVMLLAVLIVAWAARKPIASHVIDRWFAAAGMPARYTLAQVGLRTQRLTGVRIGDPARPDLVADWIEVDTTASLSGLSVDAVRIGRARLAARLAGGRVSLGALDRLLPAGHGGAFRLPATRVAIGDLRIALDGDAGPIDLAVTGGGPLDDGFSGRVCARAARIDAYGCRLDTLTADLRVATNAGRPEVHGPLSATRARCGTASAETLRGAIAASFGAALDRGRARLLLSAAALAAAGQTVRGITASVTAAGTAGAVSGTLAAQSRTGTAFGVTAGPTRIAAAYRYAARRLTADGTVRANGVAAPPMVVARGVQMARAVVGTPLAPLAQRLGGAVAAASRSGTLDATWSVASDAAGTRIGLSQLGFAAASGARAQFEGAADYALPAATLALAGDVMVGGGAMPDARVAVVRNPRGSLVGRAVVAPYAAGGGQLVLAPVTFAMTALGRVEIATQATLSGPVADGRIDRLTLPLRVRSDDTGWTVNPTCAPLSVDRVQLASFVLARAAVTLCPLDGALLRVAGGAIGGGATIGPAHFAAMLGKAPLRLAFRQGMLRLAGRTAVLRGVRAELGPPDRATWADLDVLDARLGGAPGGRFSGGSGQIAGVPLAMSAAAGTWRLTGARLDIAGALNVADTARDARFDPLVAQGVALNLKGAIVTATGTLVTPGDAVKVVDVAIRHDLSAGAGSASLSVPGITFGDRFQPERLTRATYGVIADVAGTVSGRGRVAWSPHGVTSDGVFRTAHLDLAAAFGPVTGIAGEIHFTDLLALESAPGQTLSVAAINPGVAVENGTVHFQTLAGARIKVEAARWPFADGTLSLDPTLLDFGATQARRMTFRIEGMVADRFLQQFDFKNLDATGIFDGVLPMVFDASGGRITGGRLAVRPGGGTIAYVGDLSQKDLGFWGNFAFEALKSLRYRELDIVMNGPLAGEIITEVRFAGLAQGVGAKRNFVFDRLQKLPIVFNLRIQAPFRQLIDSAQSFYDPRRLIERNLPALIEQQQRAVPPAPSIQPPDSRTVP